MSHIRSRLSLAAVAVLVAVAAIGFSSSSASAQFATSAGGPYTGVAGVPIQFQGFDARAGAAFFWNFGDGTTSAAVAPLKTYAAPGVYPVTLTVTAGGVAITVTTTATISGGVQVIAPVIAGNCTFFDPRYGCISYATTTGTVAWPFGVVGVTPGVVSVGVGGLVQVWTGSSYVWVPAGTVGTTYLPGVVNAGYSCATYLTLPLAYRPWYCR